MRVQPGRVQDRVQGSGSVKLRVELIGDEYLWRHRHRGKLRSMALSSTALFYNRMVLLPALEEEPLARLGVGDGHMVQVPARRVAGIVMADRDLQQLP